MPNIIETIATTLGSGLLTAVGAYSAVVWKLTKRVVLLEEKFKQLDDKTDELQKSHEDLEKRFGDMRVEFAQELALVKEEMTVQISDSSQRILKRIDELFTKLSEDMGDFRTTCSSRTSRYLSRTSFEQYTKEEERRWQEFYRVVGKLEAAIDRSFQDKQ